MSIEFESQDGRVNYLNEKLDNLLTGINESYGQDLLNELVIRLQRTILDFNEEIESIMGELKLSSNRRNQIIHELMVENEPVTQKNNNEENDDTESDSPEMSEWEKRLEGK
ncbi:MAG: hypothetical protein HOC41_01105 [Candidatus Marinimicrobia bacterium]|jgi:hypothetical protein|nr:hypothetical protein [Candidatus Neomarinimicrobiota bacterium]MBT4554266.1 hypothetical protein [Candidatus Neomarinimicrobiota bacterium]MBT4752957.1 hypothetical protein [Candidatus Neomarinimicrobiota bacterium]MBT5115441.1 hypothetical protein [Candidatus Neomarinimicrobiota bacterium]MBT5749199.1 hypothetical protein [Candidatus Neomarinimicrobiota bacterium]|tara:strand:+ start:323 stop:655 length:333 start_codon:yes stop_codon:yes gene_type:complete